MTPILIRQAVLSDLDALAPLLDGYRQFYGQAPDLAAARLFLRERFNHGQSVLFLALDGVAPVGFTQLYPSFSTVSLARTFILNDLFVAPAHRRRRVGASLLAAATGFAQALGAVRVTLTTDIHNTSAQATYQALGWQRDQAFYVYHFLPELLPDGRQDGMPDGMPDGRPVRLPDSPQISAD